MKPRLRKSATLDPPDWDWTERERTPSLSREPQSFSRINQGLFRDTPREGSITPGFLRDAPREGSIAPGFLRDDLREGSIASSFLRDTPREGSIAPNYSRYASLLDDKHNWGFSTLRRRSGHT